MKFEKVFIFSLVACAVLSTSILMANSSESLQSSAKNSDLLASSQPKSISLDTITVTATKTPIKVEEVPANVAITTSDDIKARAAATDAYKAISHMAGVEPVSGGMSEALIIRGKTPSVLSNGRDMNFFSGITNAPAISMSSIDRIEVLKGPQAAIHGAKAVSGVVNVIRKKGDVNHPFIETGVFGGSGKELGVNLSFGGGVYLNQDNANSNETQNGGGEHTYLLS